MLNMVELAYSIKVIYKLGHLSLFYIWYGSVHILRNHHGRRAHCVGSLKNKIPMHLNETYENRITTIFATFSIN